MYPHFGASKQMSNEYPPNQDIDVASMSQQSYEELHSMGPRASQALMNAQQRHESGVLTPHHAKKMQTYVSEEDDESIGTTPGQSYESDDRFGHAAG